MSFRGSPPRARGRRTTWRFRTGTSAVHPPVRGEDDGLTQAAVQKDRFTPPCEGKTSPPPAAAKGGFGSPPRARGRRRPRHRTIPQDTVHPPVRGEDGSCAGSLSVAQAVHPPVRGEDVVSAAGSLPAPGSPPRARGRRRLPSRSPRGRPVHPPVRGEDGLESWLLDYGVGSPPRARGRLPESAARPAGTPVHPPVRGEDVSHVCQCRGCTGSPPRARGRRPRRAVCGKSRRFTPPCEGKTRPRRSRDHEPGGSPPRARGRRVRRRAGAACHDAVHPPVRGEDSNIRGLLEGLTTTDSGASKCAVIIFLVLLFPVNRCA